MQGTSEIYNFNAGPAMLPGEVMEIIRSEFLSFKSSGMSIMEMSHRGEHFQEILDGAESDLRILLNIPDNYSIAFFPGGATLQFSAVPMNFFSSRKEKAGYSLTGLWAKKAMDEAEKLGYGVGKVFDGKENRYREIPRQISINEDYKYLYITSNNTIYGSRYTVFPEHRNLVADMTSDLLSRYINIEKFGYIFAGAQKNIGPSGLTVGIIRNDLLEIEKENVPVLLDYKVYFKNKSLYNTPPTFSIYIAGLVFKWCLEKGGMENLEQKNEDKARILYGYIDSSEFYYAPIEKNSRSIMNVVFRIHKEELEKKFGMESEKAGLIGLSGHRDAGGLRASIYNAMPISGIHKLINFMDEFKQKNS